MSITPAHMPTRFWAKVDKSGDCWEWLASKNGQGYGYFFNKQYTTNAAHRIAYFLVKGEIPDGLVTDHLCRNPGCVNPDHLELVTLGENTLRGTAPSAINAKKTHCFRGHPLSGDNVYKSYEGNRGCKTCRAFNQRNREQAHLNRGTCKRCDSPRVTKELCEKHRILSRNASRRYKARRKLAIQQQIDRIGGKEYENP